MHAALASPACCLAFIQESRKLYPSVIFCHPRAVSSEVVPLSPPLVVIFISAILFSFKSFSLCGVSPVPRRRIRWKNSQSSRSFRCCDLKATRSVASMKNSSGRTILSFPSKSFSPAGKSYSVRHLAGITLGKSNLEHDEFLYESLPLLSPATVSSPCFRS